VTAEDPVCADSAEVMAFGADESPALLSVKHTCQCLATIKNSVPTHLAGFPGSQAEGCH
jgi:hypothetical protein